MPFTKFPVERLFLNSSSPIAAFLLPSFKHTGVITTSFRWQRHRRYGDSSLKEPGCIWQVALIPREFKVWAQEQWGAGKRRSLSSPKPCLRRAQQPHRSPSSPSFPSSTVLFIIRCHRAFHTSATFPKEHHFDTLKFVKCLEEQGFTEQQSVALMKVLSDVIDESVQSLTTTLVPRPLQESTSYTQKADFAQLRTDLLSSHNAEYQHTLSEYERLLSEISKLNHRLREETTRAQNSVKLDLNLEKGRIREEASVHELKIKETDTRIESEVSSMRAMLEQVKFSTLQWLIGVCTGTAALILGVWRLLT